MFYIFFQLRFSSQNVMIRLRETMCFIPHILQQLVAWFNSSQGQIDGRARAVVAHLWLEAIHPFEDGNGRIGRAK